MVNNSRETIRRYTFRGKIIDYLKSGAVRLREMLIAGVHVPRFKIRIIRNTLADETAHDIR